MAKGRIMKIIYVAFNTFKEAVRDKILYTLVFFAVVIIISSTLLSSLTIGEQTRIIKDLGLASMSLFGLVITLFMGINLVYKEVDKRTIYPIIAKPVRRSSFLLGKYFGLLSTLIVEIGIMSFVLVVVISLFETLNLELWKAIYLIFIELAFVTAVVLLFSSFSTPILSGFFTLGIYIIGHLSKLFHMLGEKSESDILKYSVKALYYIMPNLEKFNIKSQVTHNIIVSHEYIMSTSLYALVYITLLLLFSVILFERRDFR